MDINESKFAKMCHEISCEHYDNSAHILERIKNKYPEKDNLEADKRQELLKKYIDCKFEYFNLRDSGYSEKTDLNKSRVERFFDENAVVFIRDWEKFYMNETTVYISRYSQLSPASLKDNYYNRDIPSCENWCCNRDIEIQNIKDEAIKGDWSKEISSLHKKEQVNSIKDPLIEERVISVIRSATTRISWKTDQIIKYLESGSNEKVIEDENQDYSLRLQEIVRCFACLKEGVNEGMVRKYIIDSEFLAELYLHLVNKLTEYYDKGKVIQAFLHKIKDEFHCEVCDYLEVNKKEKLLLFETATITDKDLSEEYQNSAGSEELKALIRREESYAPGDGISGSIFYIDVNEAEHMWRHIGSNDVKNDPRSSIIHKSAYEGNMYIGVLKNTGEICNFWMFPIVKTNEDGCELIGAFRVVNKLTKIGNDEVITGWTYFSRLKLAVISQWFSRFLSSINTGLLYSEDFATIIKHNKEINDLLITKGIDWIEKNFLQSLIKHITLLMGRKEENRRLGINVIIHAKDPLDTKQFKLDPYPMLDYNKYIYKKNQYEVINTCFDAVNPDYGTFIYDDQGVFESIGSFSSLKKSGVLAIKHITNEYKKSLSIYLPRDQRVITLYVGGNRIAHITYLEYSGQWKLRSQSSIEEIISEANKYCDFLLTSSVKARLADICMEMTARRYGSIIIIGGDMSKLSDQYASASTVEYKVAEKPIDQIDLEVLIEFMKKDGATFIDKDGLIQGINRHILLNGNDTDVEERKFDGRGSRHYATEKVVNSMPKIFGIVISENGTVGVISNKGEFFKKNQ